MKGWIHSIESFGTVDGPGVRYVVFFQGCTMRCQYCHNPDTWNQADGREMDADEVLEGFFRNQAFYKSGGITATGGEPLMQIDFLTELFSKAREKGVHTCLDTSGILFSKEKEEIREKFDRLMEVTSLVMLDIKHMDHQAHKVLTGHDPDAVFAFARYLEEKNMPLWIRHVVVPGITYEEHQLKALGRYIKTLSNMEHLEVLPYHAMGKVKYDNLGISYVLKDTPQLTKEEGKRAENLILDAMKEME